MTLLESVNTLPTWSPYDANRWADFIELSCLYNNDQLFSIDDMMDHYADEKADELRRGDIEHSSIFDKKLMLVKNYFEQIKYRSVTLKDHYPFDYDSKSNTLTLKSQISDYHSFYFFLLFCSNLSSVNRSSLHSLTHAFEDLSCSILKAITPSSAITEVFGTSRQHMENNKIYNGNLRKRLETLSKNLCAITTKPFDSDYGYDVSGGDGGLDLVSYLPLDELPFIPIAFAQCACSHEKWVSKQHSISYGIWSRRFGNLAPYLEYTFVPFYCRQAGGDFENPSRILTCLIDRHRIFKIIQINNNETIDEFKKHAIYKMVIDLTLLESSYFNFNCEGLVTQSL